MQKKIIDCHMHPPFELKMFEDIAKINKIEYTKKSIINEWKKNNIIAGIAMGASETKEYGFPDKESKNPMLPNNMDLPENLFFCLGVNPYKQSKEDLLDFEKALQNEKVIGIKIYGGYYPEYIYSDIYEPFYEIAKKYNVPVAIHLADVIGKGGSLKTAHPMTMDELAGKHEDITFIICHLGEPWNMDAAEVIARNKNVYGDLSGLILGDKKRILKLVKNPDINTRWKQAIAYLEYYGDNCAMNSLDKLMFGTDWPIVDIKGYIKFIEKLIPKEYHNKVFYETALNVFPKLKLL